MTSQSDVTDRLLLDQNTVIWIADCAEETEEMRSASSQRSIRAIIGASHRVRRNKRHSTELELMAAALVPGQVAL